MTKYAHLNPSLENPFVEAREREFVVPGQINYKPGLYEESLKSGQALIDRPRVAAGVVNIEKQHLKNRMTVWERLDVLADVGTEPTVLFQNWGPNLDGASIVTAIVKINGRDVAVYGHDFTVRAGSMDATNGKKLARLFQLAGKRKNSPSRDERQCWSVYSRRCRWFGGLCGGVYRTAKNQRRGAVNYVYVWLQCRRRLLSAAAR